MIIADKICKNFGPVQAVKDISFHIKKGEIVGFLGSNAAGKTTTMRILTCYFPPSSGSAKVAGFDVFEQSLEVRKNVGYLPENVPLYKDMSVEDFISFVASLKGISGRECKNKIDSAIDRCGLANVRESYIGNLSKGYRQRVGIAQAIITDPKVLILDEPTVGLDPKQIIEIRSLIKSFGGRSTVILSTHILHEIEKVCDRILLIDRGEILAFDTLENLASKLITRENIDVLIEGAGEKVKSALNAVESLKIIQENGALKENICSFQVQIDKDFAARRRLFEKMAEKDLKILEMSPVKVSAEEIFRKMVPDHIPEKKKDDSKKKNKKTNKKEEKNSEKEVKE